MTEKEVFSIKIGGQAGQGVKSSGLLFSKFAVRSGFNIYNYTEYPSLIRGGHNAMQINISPGEIIAPSQKTDILIALNQETIDKHAAELTPGGEVILDKDAGLDISKVDSQININQIPLSKLAIDAGGKELLSNTVALGSVVALLGGDLNLLNQLLSEEYGDKGNEMVEINKQAAQLGYDFVMQYLAEKRKPIFNQKSSGGSKIIVNGNDAVALGAIAAGLQFAAIYPMSPASGILHTLSANQEEYGFIYKQPEDEIAAVNMAIGASFAGARSMTSTSGGGFCLMSEGYGLAGITETPLVIIDGMRPGPGTGLPTWSEQGDLQMVLHAHQGDFPRIVLAAGDAQEAFYLTMDAFNLADKYQTPVVLLIDKNICENEQSFAPFNTSDYAVDRGKLMVEKLVDYQRFTPEPDGVSLRSVPGSGNFFIANSDEHNTLGHSSEEIADRNAQMEKRMRKLKTCAEKEMPDPLLFGPKTADVTVVSWGSNKGSILQALRGFPNVNYLHLTWISPFPIEAVTKILAEAKYLLDVECNYSAQLAALIREKTGIEILDKLLKYDGRPFFPEEVTIKLRSILPK